MKHSHCILDHEFSKIAKATYLLWPNDVHDTLALVVHSKIRHPELFHVLLKGDDLKIEMRYGRKGGLRLVARQGSQRACSQ